MRLRVAPRAAQGRQCHLRPRRAWPTCSRIPRMPAHTHILASGLTVAFERRATPGFSFHLRVPLGSAHDPAGQEGTAGVVEEWLYKGAGQLSARQFQDALDDLGVRRGGGSDAEATFFSGSGLGADLGAALALFADLVRRPLLPESELPVLLDLARQDLESLQDSPAERLGLAARQLVFGGSGYAHPGSGTPQGLSQITPASARAFWQRSGARGSILRWWPTPRRRPSSIWPSGSSATGSPATPSRSNRTPSWASRPTCRATTSRRTSPSPGAASRRTAPTGSPGTWRSRRCRAAAPAASFTRCARSAAWPTRFTPGRRSSAARRCSPATRPAPRSARPRPSGWCSASCSAGGRG